jgi:hypothetical protein
MLPLSRADSRLDFLLPPEAQTWVLLHGPNIAVRLLPRSYRKGNAALFCLHFAGKTRQAGGSHPLRQQLLGSATGLLVSVSPKSLACSLVDQLGMMDDGLESLANYARGSSLVTIQSTPMPVMRRSPRSRPLMSAAIDDARFGSAGSGGAPAVAGGCIYLTGPAKACPN